MPRSIQPSHPVKKWLLLSDHCERWLSELHQLKRFPFNPTEREYKMTKTEDAMPRCGDLIQVLRSEWYALKDGEWLRVCERPAWMQEEQAILVAPRHQVRTFWGPNIGPPDGIKPEQRSTSGGPFRTVHREHFQGLRFGGPGLDVFWCWNDVPRAGGGRERLMNINVWQCELLIDEHYRRCQEFVRGGNS